MKYLTKEEKKIKRERRNRLGNIFIITSFFSMYTGALSFIILFTIGLVLKISSAYDNDLGKKTNIKPIDISNKWKFDDIELKDKNTILKRSIWAEFEFREAKDGLFEVMDYEGAAAEIDFIAEYIDDMQETELPHAYILFTVSEPSPEEDKYKEMMLSLYKKIILK